MSELSFDETIKKFDLIVSDMNNANKKNNLFFRRICKEVFQKSYYKLEFENNFDVGAKLAATGLASAIKKIQGRYKKGSFVKSFQKLNNQTNVAILSDLQKINNFIDTSEFSFVVKLLRIQYKYGLKRTISLC